MMTPVKTQLCPSTGLCLDDFIADQPRPPVSATFETKQGTEAGLIDGVTVTPLVANVDERGSLLELLTTRDGPIEPIVHVYQVAAAPGSIRAWVFHRHQYDRLAFTMGQFEIALYDARPGSRTANRLNVFAVGARQPALLRIPPLTPSRSIRGPPPFSCASSRRRDASPVVSSVRPLVSIPPFTMRAEIEALASLGRRSWIPPFVQSSFTPDSATRASSTSTPPFVVLA